MNLAHAIQPTGKVQSTLGALLPESQKWRKSWCRRQDLNPRPSVYKTRSPAPIWQEMAVYRRLVMWFHPVIYGLGWGHRCIAHPRAKVAPEIPRLTSRDERIS
jgi:hypothetical protein